MLKYFNLDFYLVSFISLGFGIYAPASGHILISSFFLI